MDSYIYCFTGVCKCLWAAKSWNATKLLNFSSALCSLSPLIRDFHQTSSWLSLCVCVCACMLQWMCVNIFLCAFLLSFLFSYAMADEGMRWKYKMIQEWIARWLLARTDLFFLHLSLSFFIFLFCCSLWVFGSFFLFVDVTVVVAAGMLLHIACKKNSEPEINVHENLFGHVERFALHN